MNSGHRILIVDDHPLMCDSLVALIERQGWRVCAVTSKAAEAVALVREHRPDCGIIDLALEQGSGLELVKQLHAHEPEMRLLVYSMQDERLYAERALRAGALGYVHKSCTAEELLESLRRVLDGRLAVSEDLSARLVERSLFGGHERAGENPVGLLSDRELQVFELIGRGASVRDIADRLHLSPKTVQNHRDAIRQKLGLRSARELIRYAALWMAEQS